MSADKRFPHPFGKIASRYRDLRRKLPAQVSGIAAAEFKENFPRQGYRSNGGTVGWVKRRFNKRSMGRGILIKSGRLMRGIRPVPTFQYARVINNVPYAQAHNEGFTGTVTVRSHTRRGRKRGKSHTVGSFRRKMNLPERPFMITTEPLLNDIEQHTFNQLETIFKTS